MSCHQQINVNPPAPEFVEALSSGVWSRKEPIVVVFTNTIPSAEPGRPLSVSPFSLTPTVSGTAEFLDERTLVFKPHTEFNPSTLYHVSVNPGVLGLAIEPFSFTFQTVEPRLSVKPGLLLWTGDGYKLDLTITTLDKESGEDLTKVIKVLKNGNPVPVNFPNRLGYQHQVTLSQLVPSSDNEELKIVWSTEPLGSKQAGEIILQLPAKSSFSFLGYDFNPQASLRLSFNQPIQPNQDWNNIIKLNTRFTVRAVGGLLEITPTQAWPEVVNWEVLPGLKSIENQNLTYTAQGQARSLQTRLPKVDWANTGTIVPPDNLAVIPIKTINLRGVVVEAIQIFDSNLPQFFQVNSLNTSTELVRVGRSIWRESVTLPWSAANLNQEVLHLLDLRPLVERFRGGMFHLRISFLPNQVEYPIQSNEELTSLTPEDLFPRLLQGEQSYWDYWYDYDENDQNPSSRAFYTTFYGDRKIYISRNVIISHIGLLAKITTDKNLLVWATDLRSTDPISGTQIQIYDFQNQLLTQGRTDGQGVFQWKWGAVPPALAIVEHQGSKNFLKLTEGSALSISHLDVKGDAIEQGLKGFIYGERGIWRPGDNLYLTFILLDINKTLPPNHPVVLTVKDPNNNLFTRQVKTKSVDNVYHFTFATNPDSPTGNWKAEIVVGGRSFSTDLPVETIVPNRLEAQLRLPERLQPGSQVLNFQGNWLHGAPASNLNASVQVSFSPTNTTFPNFSEFTFADPGKSPVFNTIDLWKGTLNQQGAAVVRAEFPPIPEAPGFLAANFALSIIEPSGAVSTTRQTGEYRPFNSYVGLQIPPGDATRGMLLTDTDHPVRIVVVDREGRLVNQRQVRVELFKLNWRWWWDNTALNSTDFETRESRRAIITQVIPTTQGRGQWTLRVNYPEWGRYYLRVTDTTSGHSSGRIFYIDWPGWAGRAPEGADGASVLVISSDKKTYNIGETATITFPSAENSRALITVEGSGKVLRSEMIRTTPQTTRYTLRVEAGMAPNVYVHVTQIQPYQTQNQLPIRLYGTVNLNVVDPSTRVKPVIETADVFEPQSKVRINVREENGLPMTYTLAVVDEGLLGITGFSTPNPWDTFYRREASLLKHFDLYEHVSRPITAQISQRIRIGGSGEEIVLDQSSLGRYPPVVRFLGPVRLAARGRNTHDIDMPNYIGAVRIMVVAASQGTAFGNASKTVPVKKDLMVLGTLPRILAPGEATEYPVTLFWTGSGASNVNVTVTASEPGSFLGETTRIIRFTGPGQQITRFNLTSRAPGVVKVLVTATATNLRAEHEINITSRIPNQPTYQVSSQSVNPNQTVSFTVNPIGLPQTNRVTLEVSRLIPLDVSRRLAYLIAYPYGCVEQTTSAAFPQLYLDKIMALNADDVERTKNNITQALNRLKSYQNSNGSFAYWPGSNDYSDWANNYAGHFMIEAKRLGYFVEPAMLNAWVGFQKSQAERFQARGKTELRTQAYRLYLLALSGSPMVAEMNRLRDQNLEGMSQLQLAMAYQLAGQGAQASTLAARANLNVTPYRETGETFGSALRDQALQLEALSILNDQTRANDLARQVGQSLTEPTTLSTQEIAYSLIAIGRYFERFGGTGTGRGTYSWLNQQNVTLQLSDRPLTQVKLNPGAGNLRFTNQGEIPLFIRVVQEGIPDLGQETSITRGVAVAVTFTDANNRPLQIENLTQGTQIRAVVRVANLTPNRLENIALSWYVPAGWEIINSRLSGQPTNTGTVYEDYRDDRVDSIFHLNARQNLTLTFNANTTYAGRFYLPALYAGPMYNPEVQAVIPGRWVVVRSTP